ncbi:hypothetical protein RV14_GL002052 [Enterococcus ratti]|uniref:Uncharacterized protein n=1 Tax=Enterococcus ratti TaxID=150033 RepID=A0A1L8WPV1_9ENTE|nr:hypothetical protein RV14_GL002052 [Enterococcus ratti]
MSSFNTKIQTLTTEQGSGISVAMIAFVGVYCLKREVKVFFTSRFYYCL